METDRLKTKEIKMPLQRKKIGEKKPRWTPKRRAMYNQYAENMLSTGDTPAKPSSWLRTQFGIITALKGKK
jgi:hypothetical protein